MSKGNQLKTDEAIEEKLNKKKNHERSNIYFA